MELYSKFGFDVRLLEKKDNVEMFKLLEPVKLDRARVPEMYAMDRRVLKGEIVFALTEYNYNSVGLFKDDELIGISFSSIIKEEQQPWLGYFYVKPEYRKTKAPVMFINYIINHLYKGFIIQLGSTNTSLYGKLVRALPGLVGYSVFKKGVAERLSKICDRDTK